MNTKFIASTMIAVAALATTAAFASENQDGRPTPIVSQYSRAQVQAEYANAVKNGTLPAIAEASNGTVNRTETTLTREAVRAQAVQWAHATNKPVGDAM